jgi:AbrB family looped-hinge helix DNA binding protein
MSNQTVKVSSRNQIVIPAAARARLNIQSGDRLIVDIQDGMLILIPQPQSYAQQLSGLHHEIWEGVDAQTYIDGEREAWLPSKND